MSFDVCAFLSGIRKGLTEDTPNATKPLFMHVTKTTSAYLLGLRQHQIVLFG